MSRRGIPGLEKPSGEEGKVIVWMPGSFLGQQSESRTGPAMEASEITPLGHGPGSFVHENKYLEYGTLSPPFAV